MATNPTTITRKKSGPKPKDERNRAFAADYDNGLTVEELAAKYGLKPSSVKGMVMRFRRNGMITRAAAPRPPKNAERDAEIVRRYEAGGVTARQLAAEYGMTPINVSVIVRNAAMLRESKADPFVTVTVRRSDAERFVKNRKADAEYRGQATLPHDVQPLVTVFQQVLSDS